MSKINIKQVDKDFALAVLAMPTPELEVALTQYYSLAKLYIANSTQDNLRAYTKASTEVIELFTRYFIDKYYQDILTVDLGDDE